MRFDLQARSLTPNHGFHKAKPFLEFSIETLFVRTIFQPNFSKMDRMLYGVSPTITETLKIPDFCSPLEFTVNTLKTTSHFPTKATGVPFAAANVAPHGTNAPWANRSKVFWLTIQTQYQVPESSNQYSSFNDYPKDCNSGDKFPSERCRSRVGSTSRKDISGFPLWDFLRQWLGEVPKNEADASPWPWFLKETDRNWGTRHSELKGRSCFAMLSNAFRTWCIEVSFAALQTASDCLCFACSLQAWISLSCL